MTERELRVQEVIDRLLPPDVRIRVLEAGCGSYGHLRSSALWVITGIDISQKQLDRNSYMDVKILGDVQTFPLEKESFDLIISWWVLEHLADPIRALSNFVNALAPRGVIVLAFPSVNSFKGLVTKFAPHWFHVFVYRQILGRADAGKDDQAPFKTYLPFSMAPSKIAAFARDLGLQVAFLETYEAEYQYRLRRRNALVRLGWALLSGTARLFTGGRIDLSQTDCLCVLHKPRDMPIPSPKTSANEVSL